MASCHLPQNPNTSGLGAALRVVVQFELLAAFWRVASIGSSIRAF